MMDRAVNILVVEDDLAMRESCTKLFRLNGHGAFGACSGAEALEQIRWRGDIDIVLTDLKMPGMDGVALLREIKHLDPTIEVVLMTGYGTIRNAVEAMKHGAADYIAKPFDMSELLTTVGKIVQLVGMRDEVSLLRSEIRGKYRFDNIIGGSLAMRLVYEKVAAAGKTNSSVLICGESGTGKELVARAVHNSGSRAKKPFVPVNCAAIPRELIESELFGHIKGAFTGAVADSVGLFRFAEGGTIFLDEIVEMPYGTQAKLLRALQERRIRPIGGANELAVDARVIASSNQDVEDAIRRGHFREDLFYRISVIRIDLPPLRSRLEDIPVLVGHFIEKLNSVSHRTIKGIADDALPAMVRYGWPGNVRELESVIENAFALGSSDVIRKCDLPARIAAVHADTDQTHHPHAQQESVPTLLESERGLLLKALRAAQGNKTRAAQILGVSRPKVYSMMRRHGVET